MTKFSRNHVMTVARGLLLCSPVLLLAACQPPPPPPAAACDACAAAAHAQATADQALNLAQQAMSASTRTYERGLRK